MRCLSREDIRAERIDPKLRACILEQLDLMPAVVVKRHGHPFFRGRNGVEIEVSRLCAIKAEFVARIEHADLPSADKFAILNLMLFADARLEVCELGVKVVLPRRH